MPRALQIQFATQKRKIFHHHWVLTFTWSHLVIRVPCMAYDTTNSCDSHKHSFTYREEDIHSLLATTCFQQHSILIQIPDMGQPFPFKCLVECIPMPLSFGVNQHPIAVEKQRFRPTKFHQYRIQNQYNIFFIQLIETHSIIIQKWPSQYTVSYTTWQCFSRTNQCSSRPQSPQFGIRSPILPRRLEIYS